MKRNGILNSDISRVLSYMGHTDRICIGDCGLPVPDETERIDLALRFGQPSFMDVLTEVAKDMKVERIFLAEEMKEKILARHPEADVTIMNVGPVIGCHTGPSILAVVYYQ